MPSRVLTNSANRSLTTRNSQRPANQPDVSVSERPGAARHFILEDMPEGFMGAIRDFQYRFGFKNPVVKQGAELLELQFKRSDLSRTFHYAQDELVALGGVKPVSVRALPNPASYSSLNPYRVGFGSLGLTAVGGGSLGSALYFGSEYLMNTGSGE